MQQNYIDRASEQTYSSPKKLLFLTKVKGKKEEGRRKKELPVTSSLFPMPYSLCPIPYALFPIACCLLPVAYSLFPVRGKKQC
ncbi:MAG: hypothetical protein ACRC62_36145 [Microcoleus sp.]